MDLPRIEYLPRIECRLGFNTIIRALVKELATYLSKTMSNP